MGYYMSEYFQTFNPLIKRYPMHNPKLPNIQIVLLPTVYAHLAWRMPSAPLCVQGCNLSHNDGMYLLFHLDQYSCTRYSVPCTILSSYDYILVPIDVRHVISDQSLGSMHVDSH